MAAKVSLAKRDQQEGYYKNVTLNNDAGRNNYESYGINLLWDVSEKFALEGSYQKEKTRQDTPPLLNTAQERHVFCSAYGYCSPSLDEPITGDRLKVANQGFKPGAPAATRDNPFVASSLDDLVPVPLKATFDVDSYSLEARWELNDSYKVDYLFGHWESNETIVSNWDGTPEMLYGTNRPANYDQDSNELRLTYDAGGKLSYVAGVYFWDSSYDIDLRSWIGFNPDFPGQVLDLYQYSEQKTESQAVFFEGDYKLTDALTFTLGGRYTEDKKESKQYGMVNTITDPFTSHPNEKWDEFTPRVGLLYSITDDMMVYGTYSRGFRSGGFNGRVGNLVEARESYDPETVDSYEVGIKSEWLDNRLRFNANVFYMEYDDKQEELQLPDDNDTGQKTVVENAASATLQGVEFEVQAFVGEGLTLRANLGYLDTEYDDFQYTGIDGVVVDLSDLEFRRAPDWTGSLDATYEWEMAGGKAWVRGAYHYIGEHYINVTNSPELENDAQNLLDASINYSIKEFTFSVYGRNLTDEDGYIHGYDVAGLWSYAATRPPRTYGLEVVYNFGE